MSFCCLFITRHFLILFAVGRVKPELQETSPVQYHNAWCATVSPNRILVLGKFGQRSSEEMMLTTKYVCESKVPFLGIGVLVCSDRTGAEHALLPGRYFGSTRPTIFEGSETWSKGWVPDGGAGKKWDTRRVGIVAQIMSNVWAKGGLFYCCFGVEI